MTEPTLEPQNPSSPEPAPQSSPTSQYETPKFEGWIMVAVMALGIVAGIVLMLRIAG